ncbi:Cell division and transport-associated protein TolR (TC 2.C.1.2.1) [Halomonas shengliensis]|uniref:Tol-Pal system protein TolR n=1 Tax=Halomonas shengliensis TaxID=419597 RepID=A0A1H0GH45_9GAMM|nr:protein TolR [Halomonas shengliensis]SDO06071.1 Cell division and transport-associated protein TolR (TC 2.C.1.2.1) [Halomonas shengliensis]
MHGPFHRGGGRKPMGEINVVPFIDVMLVLLVIFMITAPMLTQGVQVDLPQVTSEPIDVEEQEDPVIVSVDRDGRFYLELGNDDPLELGLDELAERVIILRERNPDTPVMVRGDRNVPYGKVVSLMGTLQTAGVAKVGLISEPPSGEE